MKAVQIGAGNIGRGFLGQLFHESNYEVVFVDANADLVQAINKRKSYPLHLVDRDQTQEFIIDRVRAVDARDVDAVASELSDADIAASSVGVGALPHIVPMLAAGIQQRFRRQSPALDIILAENQWHGAAFMRPLIEEKLEPEVIEYFNENIGLVETVIGREVPTPSKESLKTDPLLIIAEPYNHLPCAKRQFKGQVPAISGLEAVDNFDAYEARKLYVSNAGHAALAYLGYPQYTYLWECTTDNKILTVVQNALEESSQAVAKAYGFSLESVREYAADILRRAGNKPLGDTVVRVAHDPLRKLRPEDRLVGAANLCIEYNIIPETLAIVIKAALKYNNPLDPAAVAMQEQINAQGLDGFIVNHCDINRESPLYKLIV